MMASKKARENIWKSSNNQDLSDVIKSWQQGKEENNIKAEAIELEMSEDE